MEINFFNNTNHKTEEFEELINKLLSFDKSNIMDIIFVNDDEIHKMNKEKRNVDRITDVISFALNDNESFFKTKEIGDIFIDIDQAIRQAEEYGHSLNREIGFLAVHGYLHLMGYDHMTKEDEEKMFAKQDEILNACNLRR